MEAQECGRFEALPKQGTKGGILGWQECHNRVLIADAFKNVL